MVARNAKFDDLIEMVEKLPLEERASLLSVLQKRMAADERRRIEASIRAARREHARGRTKPVTPDELMAEILS